jgi:hypothetical protein
LLSHRRRIATPVEGFVGFAVGRSILEGAIAAHRLGELDDACAVTVISREYLRCADRCRTSDPSWCVASPDHGPDRLGADRRAGTVRRPAWSTRS